MDTVTQAKAAETIREKPFSLGEDYSMAVLQPKNGNSTAIVEITAFCSALCTYCQRWTTRRARKNSASKIY